MTSLTPKQFRVLRFIDGYIKQNGFGPSFEEIGIAVGVSSLATVAKYITKLEEKGYLRRDFRTHRHGWRAFQIVQLP